MIRGRIFFRPIKGLNKDFAKVYMRILLLIWYNMQFVRLLTCWYYIYIDSKGLKTDYEEPGHRNISAC